MKEYAVLSMKTHLFFAEIMANRFVRGYCRFLEKAKEWSSRTGACNVQSFHLIEEFQNFKTIGKGRITDCKTRSVILPFLADHVLREANHYLQILEQAQEGGKCYGFM